VFAKFSNLDKIQAEIKKGCWMIAYHLQIQDESIVDKVMAFLKTLPNGSVEIAPEAGYDEELDSLLEQGFASPISGTHEEVVARFKRKHAIAS
jgi:acylphosphatase